MKQSGSPQKLPHQYPKNQQKDLSTGSETEESVKNYKAIPNRSLHDQNNTNTKKSSDLGLIDGYEQEDEDSQNTHVELDLCKGILLMAKSKQLAAIGGLLGAFAIHLIVGAIYRWNMITGYVGIYFQTDTITPIGAPLYMLCAGLTMRIGAKMSEALGSRFVLSVGMLLAGVATIIGSQAHNFGVFLLFHNVLYGLSAGLVFLPPLLECHKFFPKLKLITNSIILTGTGLGAVLFGASNIECIQNDYQTVDISDQELKAIVDSHFPGCFMKMGVWVFIIGFSGVLMMIPLILRNQERDKEEREVSVEERQGNYCQNQWQSFKSRVFWVVALVIFLTTCGNFYIIMNYKNLLSAEHHEKTFLYWILISGALANGLPRLIWGFVYSRIGFKILFCVAVGMNLLSFICIMAINNETVYLIFYILNSVSLGGMMVIFPNVVMIVFGKKIGEKVYSYYWVAFALANFFQFLITVILTDNPNSRDEYSIILIFFTICVIIGLVICVKETLQGPWKNSLDLVEFGRTKKSRKYST